MEIKELEIQVRIRMAISEFNASEHAFDSKSIRRTIEPSAVRVDFVDKLAENYFVKSSTLMKIILCRK